MSRLGDLYKAMETLRKENLSTDELEKQVSILEENIIKKVGGSPDVKKHLEDLGFVVGGSVTVVNTLAGNVIVNIKESRVAISEEMARKIMV